MSLVVIGLTHRTVPLELLERMTISEARLPKALADVASREHIREAVILSTCNRTEIYAVAEKFHGAYADLRDFLAETAFLGPEGFSDLLYVQHDEEAVAHLFSVAAGLDSAVLGEAEILGQVRRALERARQALESVGLGNRLHHRPNQLSGGQQQRVAIARALINRPPLILADEPTGNLDSRSSIEIMDLMHPLHQQGVTIVMVTHEPDVAAHAQRVMCMLDGKVISDGRDGGSCLERQAATPLKLAGALAAGGVA